MKFFAIAVLFLSPALCFAKGSIGIAAEVGTDGIFSPEISHFKISEVKPDSAAEAAGILVGDQVVAIDGCRIPGCPASKAKKLMAREAGDTLPLTIQRNGGEETLITIHVR